MGDDLRIGILDGRQQPVGHRRAVQVHVGVHRGHHNVQLRQHFVVEIETPVLQDVHLDAGEQANAQAALVRGADLLNLFEHALFVQSVGHRDRLAVVRQRNVLVAEFPRGFSHLLDGVAAVARGGMHL